MPWIILLFGAGLLWMLAGTKNHSAYRAAPVRREGKTADDPLSGVWRQTRCAGFAGIPFSGGLLREWERNIRALSHADADTLPPAARPLVINGRMIQEQTAEALRSFHHLPRLPRSAEGWPRILRFAQDVITDCDTLTESVIRKALEDRQAKTPFTLDELEALPALFTLSLTDLLCRLARQCRRDQNVRRAALRFCHCSRNGQKHTAQKLVRRFGSEPAFIEAILRPDGLAEQFHNDQLPKETTAEQARSEQKKQAHAALQAERFLRSACTIRHLPWKHLIESQSIIHQLLSQDAVYPKMDDESRAHVRSQSARIACMSGRSERAVCEETLSLCRSAASHTPASSVCFFLADDGLPVLLERLHAYTPLRRAGFRFRRHSIPLFRFALWSAFLLFLAAAYFTGCAIGMLIPVGLLFTLCLLPLADKINFDPKPLLRMALKRLDSEQKVLVVCTEVLQSAEQAIAAVRRLSVMHEANPDRQIHFLLLGDFEDSLTAYTAADHAIIAAASAAVEALREDSDHPFFYLQRERICLPGERSFRCRSGRRGALETILCLAHGRSVHDSFVHVSTDPASLHGQYRYVVFLRGDALLPPGSILKMVGAMTHPLQKRQAYEGRLRGAGMLRFTLQPQPSRLNTRFARWSGAALGRQTAYCIDPGIWLNAVQGVLPEGRMTGSALPEEALAGCASADIADAACGCAQKLSGLLSTIHQNAMEDWQLLPCLIPVIGYRVRKKLDPQARFLIRRAILENLLAPLSLTAMVYALLTGREWLLAAAALLPLVSGLLPLSPASLVRTGMRLAVLPCEACVRADAALRVLYRLLILRRPSASHTPPASPAPAASQPSMLLFHISMSFAALFAASPLLLGGAWGGFFLAVLWAALPILLPFAEQTDTEQSRPTEYMRELLMRLARKTLLFFETAITPETHALPPAFVQIEPNKGIARCTTPADIALYLCSLISAQKLELISADDMTERMRNAVCSLEKLPKWNGLLYERYDVHRLLPQADEAIPSSANGLLAVSLLTCAQGLRMLLPVLREKDRDLPVRLDQLCRSMQLEKLYDEDAGQFRTEVHPSRPASAAHHQLLASESRLLSFAAIMQHAVPGDHWQHLSRAMAAPKLLLSPSGSMADHMLPLLFLPAYRGTLMAESIRRLFRRQYGSRLGGAFGISHSACHAFDPAMHYQHRAFGLPEMALNTSVESNVVAPYASMLCLPHFLKPAFLNIRRLNQLGLEGALGFFDAADFSHARAEGKAFAVVRSHSASHQGMILCSVCNTLCGQYLLHLFSDLPKAQAFLTLLEELPSRSSMLIHRPLIRPGAEAFCREEALFSRVPALLTEPPDGHLLSGDGTTLFIDAHGGGWLKKDDQCMTRYSKNPGMPSGIFLYLRDSQSGTHWLTTDPHLARSVRFEAAQAVFQSVRQSIESELRIWINPLDGTCIHCLTVKNASKSERVLEVCSYLEPAAEAMVHTERLGRHGVSASFGCSRLWHTVATRTEWGFFRIQTDRCAFIGRGRSLLSPRAMDTSISAPADSLGSMPDPCLSLRGQFALSGGETAVFCFLTCPANAQMQESAFLRSHSQPEDALRSFRYAQLRSRELARSLRLRTDVQEAVSRIAGRLAASGQRASLSLPDAPDLRGQFPILLYICPGCVNEPMLKTLLHAHSFCRLNGLDFDLAILIEECPRQAEVSEDVRAVLNACHSSEKTGIEGGVHLLSQLSETDKALLHGAAQLMLSAGGGTPEEQLKASFVSFQGRPVYHCRSSNPWGRQLPDASHALLYPNGTGGFVPETVDYQITLPPGRMTPAPWCNHLSSDAFCTIAAESGLLHSRLPSETDAAPCRCPANEITPQNEEQFFLRDPDEKLLWSLTRLPLGHSAAVRVTHAPGETVYESSGYGIYARITCFSDTELPVGLRIIQLRNESRKERRLAFFHTCRFPCIETQASLNCTQDGAWLQAPEPECSAGLLAVDPPEAAASVMASAQFQGLWGTVPYALSCMEHLPQGSGDTAILRFDLRLQPGESHTLTTMLLAGIQQEEALALLREEGASRRLQLVRQHWENLLGAVQFDLPDQALNLLLGRWLPVQVWCFTDHHDLSEAACACLPLLTLHPQEAGMRLLNLVRHISHPKGRYALMHILSLYLEATQDESLFAQQSSVATDTLLQQLHQIVETLPFGAHGLPLDEQANESACAGMLLCETLRRFAVLYSGVVRDKMLDKRRSMMEALERSAWDGRWYLHGWDKNGRPIGSTDSEDCRIALLPQTLAVMCGLSRERCEAAMAHAWLMLYDQTAGMIKACDGQNPQAGLREDQDTSAACAAMCALHQLGQDEKAWELLGALMPPHHTATRMLTARYRAEPYVMAASVHAAPGVRGRAFHPRSAKAAACFWYAAVHQLLGLRISGQQLSFRPVVPQSWDQIRVTLRHGSATYHLHAKRSCLRPEADGALLPDGVLELKQDGRSHEAFFPLRS